MLRRLYSVILVIFLPAILLRLWWRGRANPAYRHRIGERLGYFRLTSRPDRLWIHAVSVGEVNVAVPVIKKIKQRRPALDIVMTTTTPTGADQVNRSLADLVTHRYFPYDIAWIIKRVIRQVNPAAIIVMETEIWPNLIHVARERHIPLVFLNLRLSQRSYPGYRRVRALVAPALARVNTIGAQTQADAKRIIELGAIPDHVQVTGNIKFDVSLPEGVIERGRSLRRQLGQHRPVWIAASTHHGEDEQVLNAHRLIRDHYSEALLILVPRHPERFSQVFELANKQFSACNRTQQINNFSPFQVYIGNTMGELFDLYAASDVGFVGGSLVAHGGQNILEPWLAGKPVVVGPHTFNFAQTVDQALNAQALIQVQTPAELAQSVIELFQSPARCDRLVRQAQQLLGQNKGALDQSVSLLEGYLKCLSANSGVG